MLRVDSVISFLIISLVICVQGSNVRHLSEKQLIDELENVHRQVRTLSNSLQKLRVAVDNVDCHMNINAQLCRDSATKEQLDAMQLLRDAMNPGKRSESSNLKASMVSKRYSQDIAGKRLMLNELQALLREIAERIQREKKRSCVMNLAYRCNDFKTMKDTFHQYSVRGPGKRKRSTYKDYNQIDA